MHIEFLVEEPSAEEALRNLIPRILKEDISFRIHPHQGKKDLITKLPGRLRGYTHWMPDYYRIVVLIDEDRQDCLRLKRDLEQAALTAGLTTKSSVQPNMDFQVLNRIAIEELEAWFFGDTQALKKAYPKVSATLGNKSKYRNPDAIPGGTWEALERVLQSYGYYKGGMPKIEVARKISDFMSPNQNRSNSFLVFRDGLLSL